MCVPGSPEVSGLEVPQNKSVKFSEIRSLRIFLLVDLYGFVRFSFDFTKMKIK